MTEPMEGYKTYIAGGLAMCGGLYYILFTDEMSKGFELFVVGLGLFGLRSKLERMEH